MTKRQYNDCEYKGGRSYSEVIVRFVKYITKVGKLTVPKYHQMVKNAPLPRFLIKKTSKRSFRHTESREFPMRAVLVAVVGLLLPSLSLAAPNHPENLRLENALPAIGSVTVRWDSVSGAKEYLLKHRFGEGGPWDEIQTGTSRNWPFSELLAGTHYFKVSVCDDKDCSTYSPSISFSSTYSNETGGDTGGDTGGETGGDTGSDTGGSTSAEPDGSVLETPTIDLGSLPIVTRNVHESEVPLGNPNPVSTAETDSMVDIGGSFSVSNSGAATYELALNTPAGTKGVKPSLSVSYSSKRGNSIMGHGWLLGGIPAITRCRATAYTDGIAGAISFSSGDRFCLGNKRLILTEGDSYGQVGAVYRTEMDGFYDVESVGGVDGAPDYFVIHGRNGGQSTYGAPGEDNSEQKGRLLDGSVTGNVLRWSISRKADQYDNAVDYSYLEDSDGQRIDLIEYAYGSGTSPNATVEFEYTDRDDKVESFVGGNVFKRSKLLETIIISNGGTTESPGLQEFRTYSFTYHAPDAFRPANELTQINECVGDTCKQPLVFNWSEPGELGYGPYVRESHDQRAGSYGLGHRVEQGDFDGDGYTDLAWRGAYSSSHKFVVMSNDGLNYDYDRLETVTHSRSALVSSDVWRRANFDQLLVNNGSDEIEAFAFGRDPEHYLRSSRDVIELDDEDDWFSASDLDGDGIADLILARNDGQPVVHYGYRRYYGGQHREFFSDDSTAIILPQNHDSGDGYRRSYSLTNERTLLADLNGDGRMDLLVVNDRIVDAATCATHGTCANGNATSTLSVLINQGREVFTPAFHTEFSLHSLYDDVRVGDINADGMADLLIQTNGAWKVLVSDGLNSFAKTFDLDSAFNGDDTVRFGTVNGDRYQDIIGNGQFQLYNPQSARLGSIQTDTIDVAYGQSTVHVEVMHSGEHNSTLFADVNNDGILDFVDINTNNWEYQPGLRTPRHVVSIDPGLAPDITIQYDTLKNASLYTKLNDAFDEDWVYKVDGSRVEKVKEQPVYDVRPGRFAVSSVSTFQTAYNDDGTSYSVDSGTEFHYTGARVQAGGRGSLGFAEQRKTRRQGEEEPIVSISRYRQDYPFVGMTYEAESLYGEQNPVTTATSEVEYRFVTGAHNAPYIIYAANTTAETFDVATQRFRNKTTTVKAVDQYGNTTYKRVQNYGNDGNSNRQLLKTTDTFYQYHSSIHDAAERGLVTDQSVVITTADDTIQREIRYEYYETGAHIGRLSTTTQYPDTVNVLETSHEYDDLGRLAKTTQSGRSDNGAATQDRYIRKEFDAAGRYTERAYVYTGNNQVSEGGAPGELLTYEVLSRNSQGQPTSERDAEGLVKHSSYTPFGAKYADYFSSGSWTTVSHSFGPGQHCPADTLFQTRIDNADGSFAIACIDNSGRGIRRVRSGFTGMDTLYADYLYDERGRPFKVSTPYNALLSGPKWISYSFDERTGTNSATFPDGTQASTQTLDYTTVKTNALGNTRTTRVNGLGQLVEAEDALGGTVEYSYDAAGNLESTTVDGEGVDPVVTQIFYDNYGRKSRTVDPSSGETEYDYNAFGELVYVKDANLQEHYFGFDPLGRKVTEDRYYADGSLARTGTWTYDHSEEFGYTPSHLLATRVSDYDQLGNETSSELKVFGYDSLGRMSAIATAFGGDPVIYSESLTYDELGRRHKYFGIAGEDWGTESHYNDVGSLYRVTETKTGELYKQIEAFSAHGKASELLLGNGVYVTHTYDDTTNRLTDIMAGLNGELQHLSFRYDAIGQIIGRKNEAEGSSNTQEAFCYDELNRLVAEVEGQFPDASEFNNCPTENDFEYDAHGNLISKQDALETLTYDTTVAGPHATTSNSFTYDAMGNMVSDISRNFTYSSFNKVSRIDRESDFVEFQYGINKRRYKRTQTVGNVDSETTIIGNSEVIRTDSGITIKRYVDDRVIVTHSAELAAVNGTTVGIKLKDTSNQYLLKDNLGSVVSILDDTGDIVVQSMWYGAFGDRRDPSNIDYELGFDAPFDTSVTTRGFTGHEMVDDFGVIHMNGRIYDVEVGRFLQADPYVVDPTDTQSYNRYSYVRNNPLNATDPSGYCERQLGRVDNGSYSVWQWMLVGCGSDLADGGASDDPYWRGPGTVNTEDDLDREEKSDEAADCELYRDCPDDNSDPDSLDPPTPATPGTLNDNVGGGDDLGGGGGDDPEIPVDPLPPTDPEDPTCETNCYEGLFDPYKRTNYGERAAAYNRIATILQNHGNVGAATWFRGAAGVMETFANVESTPLVNRLLGMEELAFMKGLSEHLYQKNIPMFHALVNGEMTEYGNGIILAIKMVEIEQMHVQEYIDGKFPNGPPIELLGGEGEWGVNEIVFGLVGQGAMMIGGQITAFERTVDRQGGFDYWDFDDRVEMGTQVMIIEFDPSSAQTPDN